MMNSQAAKASPRWRRSRPPARSGRWLEIADAVDYQGVENIPARFGLFDNALQCLLRHAGVVFQAHAGNRITLVDVAHQSEKTGDGADF